MEIPRDSTKFQRFLYGYSTCMEKIYTQKEETRKQINLKVKYMANREKVKTIFREYIQDHHRTNIYLWNRTLGLCKQIKYLYHPKKPIQNIKNDHEHIMVCI